jgi:NitT/TauT family transport system permease protein
VQLWKWTVTGFIFPHLATTFVEMAAGLALAIPPGIAAGILVGSSPLLSRALTPYVMAAYNMPHIALIPLFVIWFGVGIPSKIALAGLAVFFTVFLNAYAGVQSVEGPMIGVFRLLGASEFEIFTKLVLPHASAWILNGIRVSIPLALVTSVGGEILISQRGIGYILSRAMESVDPTALFAALVILMLVGSLLNGAVMRIEARVLRWRDVGHEAPL